MPQIITKSTDNVHLWPCFTILYYTQQHLVSAMTYYWNWLLTLHLTFGVYKKLPNTLVYCLPPIHTRCSALLISRITTRHSRYVLCTDRNNSSSSAHLIDSSYLTTDDQSVSCPRNTYSSSLINQYYL